MGITKGDNGKEVVYIMQTNQQLLITVTMFCHFKNFKNCIQRIIPKVAEDTLVRNKGPLKKEWYETLLYGVSSSARR